MTFAEVTRIVSYVLLSFILSAWMLDAMSAMRQYRITYLGLTIMHMGLIVTMMLHATVVFTYIYFPHAFEVFRQMTTYSVAVATIGGLISIYGRQTIK